MNFNLRKTIDWDRPVSDNVYPFDFIYGSASLVSVGPPLLPDLEQGQTIDLYPLGLAMQVMIDNASNGRRIMPVREIGSYHVFFVPGELPLLVGGIVGLYSARGSLLKYLMSYYLRYDDTLNKITNDIDDSLFTGPNAPYRPDPTGSFTPNSAGMFLNPYSILFYFPFGIDIIYQNIAEQPGYSAIPEKIRRGVSIAHFYIERCSINSWRPLIQLMAQAPVVQADVQFFAGFMRMIPLEEPPVFDDSVLYGKNNNV